ncbi:tRNA pseudouridine(13) synthase TruD [Porticoccus sp.]
MSSRQFTLDFPRALGAVPGRALFRQTPEDFQVTERLGFELAGEGEHLCLYLEKRGQNTRWVAGMLAEHFAVDDVAVGYCGMKDRHALTRQWFSVYLPGSQEAPASTAPVIAGCSVLETVRHNKKLRRGVHADNHFVIRLRQLEGDRSAVERRLGVIASQGVPNYFGEQRFGREAGNLLEADRLLKSKAAEHQQRRRKSRQPASRGGLYLSAARAYLFNLVLAERVRQQNWNRPLEGEMDPSGPMWGRGRSQVPEPVRLLESAVLQPWQDWCHGLEFSGLSQERRVLSLLPGEFSWHWLGQDDSDGTNLQLSFSLPSGCFATALLREVAELQSPRAVAE